MNVLGTFIFVWLAFATMFPKKTGTVIKELYNKFMEGWKNENK